MITLGNQFSNTHKLKLQTSAAVDIDYYISGYERKAGGIITEFSRQNTISTATITDVVTQTNAGIKTTITYMSVRNTDATTSCDVTVLYYDSSINEELYKVTLAAGERFEYTSGGFL